MKTFITFLLTLALAAGVFMQKTNAQVTVTGSTGANATYASLRLAFNAINTNTNQNGNNIVITITANTTETASASLTGQASNTWATLKIYPTVSGLTISGAFAGSLITLNGADNVTIDGSLNGSGATASLTIANSVRQAIGFLNGATSNLIRYCTLKGSYNTAAYGGIVDFHAGGANSNNTLEYNNITNGGTRVYNAIFSTGDATYVNAGNTIRYNNIYDYCTTGSSNGIILSDYNSGWTIQGNSFYETSPLAITSSGSVYFINVQYSLYASGTNFIVRGNYMGGTAPQ